MLTPSHAETVQDTLFALPEARQGLGSVVPIQPARAAEFIRHRHYLHSAGATSHAFGLWRGVELAGVCTYGTIIAKNAAAICGERWAESVLELTRLVLTDEAPRNSESYLIGQTFRQLPRPRILLSYADSAAGHVGTIYQATNWLYTGVSTKGGYITADGEQMHARSVSDARKNINAASSGLDLHWQAGPPKHRYVNFVGSRTDKRAMREALRWPVLCYPRLASC